VPGLVVAITSIGGLSVTGLARISNPMHVVLKQDDSRIVWLYIYNLQFFLPTVRRMDRKLYDVFETFFLLKMGFKYEPFQTSLLS
jgi:hypothetical protein